MEEKKFKEIMQQSKLEIQFPDFEYNVMEQIRAKESSRRSVWRNLRISWVFFFVVWQLRGKFPDILKDPVQGKEATKLFADANAMLDSIIEGKWLTANAVIGIYPANSIGDDIEVYKDESRNEVIARFSNLRNQKV